ncbi:hypothetical protein CIRMBP1210_01515 [Enterococcus cecorum]|nr:hypothetical protein CIRMBP1210_01515 [Enterococcus cecorum]
MSTNNLSRVSKEKQIKGKKNTQRRYSLLLLILLFIGFATYGTYSYFTTSTSLAKVHRKLKDSSFNLGEDETKMRQGDGTAGAQVNNSVNYRATINPLQSTTNDNTTDSNGGIVPNNSDSNDNSNQSTNNHSNTTDTKYKEFGEFDWVYVGNTSGRTIMSLADTFNLAQNNPYLSSVNANTYNNVKSGDVFRKTVRLKVKGNSSTPANVTLRWGKVENESLDLIQAVIYVKKAKLTSQGEAPMFTTDGFLTAFDSIPLTSDAQYTSDKLIVQSGDYLDVEMVIAVKNDAVIPRDVPLAKVERQLSIVLAQDTGNILDV